MKYILKKYQKIIGEIPTEEQNNTVGYERYGAYDDSEMIQRTSPSIGFIIAIICIISFLVLIVITLFLSAVKSKYMMLPFGVAILEISILAFVAFRKKPTVYFSGLFLLIGLFVFGFGYINSFGTAESIVSVKEKFPEIFMLLSFTGAFLSFASYIATKKRKQTVYTEQITTTCCALIVSSSKGRPIYCPVYSIQYNNRTYHIQEEIFSNISVPQVGAEVTLYVNPADPYDFCRKNSSGKKMFLIVSGFLAFIGVMLMFFG